MLYESWYLPCKNSDGKNSTKTHQNIIVITYFKMLNALKLESSGILCPSEFSCSPPSLKPLDKSLVKNIHKNYYAKIMYFMSGEQINMHEQCG